MDYFNPIEGKFNFYIDNQLFFFKSCSEEEAFREVFACEFANKYNIEHADYDVACYDDFFGVMEKVFSYFPRLKERRKQTAGTLSGGEQQMLAMGRALMSRPKLMLLDEPSMGLSPLLVSEIFEIIRRLNENGTTILLVEQNAALALKLAHRAAVMETGRIVLSGTGEELSRSPEVQKAYLGG